METLTSNKTTSELCGICSESLDTQFSYQLSCGHTFHYECIFTTFKHENTSYMSSLHCPYCRQKVKRLPLVNGIRKIHPNIHAIDDTFESVPCNHILKTGKNKGQPCNKNCFLGYFQCKRHFKKI